MFFVRVLSSVSAAAFLIFFAASAGAGIVSAGLFVSFYGTLGNGSIVIYNDVLGYFLALRGTRDDRGIQSS